MRIAMNNEQWSNISGFSLLLDEGLPLRLQEIDNRAFHQVEMSLLVLRGKVGRGESLRLILYPSQVFPTNLHFFFFFFLFSPSSLSLHFISLSLTPSILFSLPFSSSQPFILCILLPFPLPPHLLPLCPSFLLTP